MEAGDRVGAAVPVHLRQVSDGSPRSDEFFVGCELPDLMFRKHAANVPAQVVCFVIGRGVGAEEPIAQPKGTEGKAPRVGQRAVTEPSQLDASAPDVHDHPVLGLDPVDGAEERVPGLFLPVDDPDGQPALHQNPLEQLVGVLRFADGGGCHRDRPARTRALGDGLEVLQRVDRPLDRLGAEAPAIAHVSGQPERRTAVAQDLQVPGRVDPEDDHSARVRAQVDDRQGLVGHVATGSAGQGRNSDRGLRQFVRYGLAPALLPLPDHVGDRAERDLKDEDLQPCQVLDRSPHVGVVGELGDAGGEDRHDDGERYRDMGDADPAFSGGPRGGLHYRVQCGRYVWRSSLPRTDRPALGLGVGLR